MVANKSGLVIDIGAAKSPESPIYMFARARSLTLQALERDLGGLNKTSWDEGAVYGAVRYRGASGGNNTASWEGEEGDDGPSRSARAKAKAIKLEGFLLQIES